MALAWLAGLMPPVHSLDLSWFLNTQWSIFRSEQNPISNGRRMPILLIYNEIYNCPVCSCLLSSIFFPFRQKSLKRQPIIRRLLGSRQTEQVLEGDYFNGCCHPAVIDSLTSSPLLRAQSCHSPCSWSLPRALPPLTALGGAVGPGDSRPLWPSSLGFLCWPAPTCTPTGMFPLWNVNTDSLRT